jgi:hypothetical protein
MLAKWSTSLNNGLAMLLSIPKILIWFRFSALYFKRIEAKKSIILLGNGPSLAEDIDLVVSSKPTSALMALNNFATTSLFSKLQPEYYMLQAPELWQDDVSEELSQYQESIIAALQNDTSWPMQIFMPYFAREQKVTARLKKNSNLQVVFFNQIPIEGPRWFTKRLWEWKWGGPRIHNTLVACLLISFHLRFRTVYLCGADHSWHETILFDESGHLRNNYSHFYAPAQGRKVIKFDGTPFLLHEFFRKLYLTFKGYHDLASFAKYKGVQVFNMSSKSYIDAFPKKKP